jgi:hypothetical protein
MLRLNTPCFRLRRQPPVLGNLDEAATMTVGGPTLTALANVLIVLPLFARGLPRWGITTLSPRGRGRARLPSIAVHRAPEQPT